jgi:hypothetical protein
MIIDCMKPVRTASNQSEGEHLNVLAPYFAEHEDSVFHESNHLQ